MKLLDRADRLHMATASIQRDATLTIGEAEGGRGRIRHTRVAS